MHLPQVFQAGRGVYDFHHIRFAAFARSIVHDAHARTQGVKVSLENTPQTAPEDFNAVFARLARMPEVAAGRVGMCLDMGHANLCPSSRNDYLGFVDRLETHVPIIHWHAHENWGDRDSHLPLFTGPSAKDDAGLRGLVWRLVQRGFRGNVVLEQWPNPPEQLVQCRERLRLLAPNAGKKLKQFLEGLPQRYVRAHSAPEILKHFEMASAAGSSGVQLNLHRSRHWFELTVVTTDRPQLFSRISGALAAWGMDITKAGAFSNDAGVVFVMSFGISSNRYPTASFAPMRAMGNPVALDASADDRDTRGFISITSNRPSRGLTANCTLDPPVSTPILRSTAIEASRMR